MKIQMLCSLMLMAAMSAQAADIRTPTYESRPKFYKEGGEIKGLCIDVLKAVEKLAPDIKFVLEYGVPLKRVEYGVVEGTYDLLLCGTPTPERTANMRMINVSIYTVDDVLAVRADDPLKDATLDDIRKLSADNSIMTYAGTGQQTWLEAQPGLKTDANAANPEVVFQKLEAKRGRFVFASEAIVANVLKQPAFAGKFRVLPTPVRSAGRFFFFSKKAPSAAINKVEAALKELASTGELKKIAGKYVLE